MSLDLLWRQLSEDPYRPATGYLSRRAALTAPCDVHAAIEFPSANRVLLVGVPAGPLRRAGALPRSVGVEARQVFIERTKAGMATVALRLTDNRYTDIFTVVAEDVSNCLTRAADGAAAVSALIARLRKWQQFLDRHPPEGLGPLAQQGLYGELWFLHKVLVPAVGPRRAVDAWVGPLAANQDFQLGVLAVEVKTSTTKLHQTLEIASERQLDSTGVTHLFLGHLSLDERKGSGETLPVLVASVRQAVSPDPLAADVFEARLLDAGYLDTHAARYAESGYTLRESHFFRVAGDFPRIVEADLRSGVGHVRYSVSVAECIHYQVDEATVVGLMGGEKA